MAETLHKGEFNWSLIHENISALNLQFLNVLQNVYVPICTAVYHLWNNQGYRLIYDTS